MDFYYFNTNTDNHGWHEIHKEKCSFIPSLSDRELIGYFSSPEDALHKAKADHPLYTFDGCYYCCSSINHG